MTPIPLTRDLVLIGGGHAHALVLRMWGMRPLPGVRLTLINPDPAAPYTGMLPGYIAGHYRREEMMIDLVRLARHAGARLILGRAEALDRESRQVHVAGRPPIAYDVASLDIGVTSDLPALPGFAEHAVAAKPLGPYAEKWDAFLAQELDSPRIIILGGGIGGVELALATAHRLGAPDRRVSVLVLERGQHPLSGIGAGARRALTAHLHRLGVVLLPQTEAVRINESEVHLADGSILPADLVLGVAGARAQDWLAATGLDLTHGYVTVSQTLQSSDPVIFAAGDCAHMAFAPRPKAGVFAVRQAPILLHNLRNSLSGGTMREYRPQRDYLKLVSTGGKGAVADKWGLRLDGPRLWQWKDRIDRDFIDKFGVYPAMDVPEIPGERAEGLDEILRGKPLCGGCGAKVGPAGLSAALANLPLPQRADVLSGPGDDAAILKAGGGFQVMTTDHLRAFTEDPWLMARIAATHALGDIWAMGAMPQVALAQVILPRLSPALQTRTLAEIMAAAGEVFAGVGADVVGGHTSIGSELTIGFTVTGLAPRIVEKGGAQPGDALILTKPIGSGTILAAEMARARIPGAIMGEAVARAHAVMARSSSATSALLAPLAHAMTDVTGFGLAGHLMEMLDASGTAARIELGAVPFIPGAEALAAAGHASSLAPANRAVALRMEFAESARAALLFDPQTGGGLLAAVPGDTARPLIEALRQSDPEAAIIGEVVAGTPFILVK